MSPHAERGFSSFAGAGDALDALRTPDAKSPFGAKNEANSLNLRLVLVDAISGTDRDTDADGCVRGRPSSAVLN